MQARKLQQALTGEGMPVIRCEMLAGVEDEFNEQLVEGGIGVADYGVGAAAEIDDATASDTGPATRSFDVLRRVTRTGAYGILTRDKHRHLAVGVATPPCGLFLRGPARDAKKEIVLKGFQFDRYTTVTPDSQPDIQDRIKQVLVNYPHQTLTTIKKDQNRDTIYEMIHELERRGLLSASPIANR